MVKSKHIYLQRNFLILLFYQQFFGGLLFSIHHQIQKKVLGFGMHRHRPGFVLQLDFLLVAATVAVLDPGCLLLDPVLGGGHPGVHVRELLTVAPA